jgi:hypothetical protein
MNPQKKPNRTPIQKKLPRNPKTPMHLNPKKNTFTLKYQPQKLNQQTPVKFFRVCESEI